MNEIYNNYLNYNFEESLLWKDYLKRIYPPPPENRIEYFKKEFYKNKIDNNFDVNYIPNKITIHFNYNELIGKNGIELFYIIFNYLMIFVYLQFFYLLCFLYFIIKSIEKEGMIKFTKEYLLKITKNYDFSLIILSLIIMIDGSRNIFLSIIFILREFLYLLKIIKILYKHPTILKIWEKREKFIQICSNCEFFGFFPLIYGIFVGMNSFFFIIIYAQYLKFRYYCSPHMNQTVQTINNYLDDIKNNQSTPEFIKNGINIINKIVNFSINNISNVIIGGGSVMICQIF
jgi:hypothetical protein